MIDPAWETRQLLFVYGSLLLPIGDDAVDAAVASGIPLGEAWMRGTLYDLGEYPGAKPVPDPRSIPASGAGTPGAGGYGPGAPRILGRLLGFPDPEPAFAVLDRYEGFDPGSPESGEFARAPADVVLAGSGRRVTAQVYLYVPPTAGKALIPSGDYLAYRRMRREART